MRTGYPRGLRRQSQKAPMPNGAATKHLILPKLVTTLVEGYPLTFLRQDLIAALTVAIVALPLSMAIAVASGVSPARGMYTAIVGGFLVSALSGSRYQIGGPAGAFVVLVAATVTRFGIDGLLLTVLLSGLMLTGLGVSRLGSLIRYIPHAVTVGFTFGIAITIVSSQLRDLAGLRLTGVEPGPLIPKLVTLVSALGTLNPVTLALGLASVALIFGIRRYRPTWPGMLIAVVFSSVIAAVLHLSVQTIGTRFGELPHGLPLPRFPSWTPDLVWRVLPAAISFMLLGGIESLLSAKVADGMTGRQHRSNMELIAQGIANIGSALFGGISVTGTIARTATNVRAGARSPLAGMMHSIFLLLFLIIAAPLASFVPLTTLASVLVVVCWNMAEKAEFARLLRNWRTGGVLVTTVGVTLLKDLTFGIIAGCLLAAALTLSRPRPLASDPPY